MKKTSVYMCSKGHLHYCDDPPKVCNHQNCGCKEFGLISCSNFDLEEDDGLSEESRYNSS